MSEVEVSSPTAVTTPFQGYSTFSDSGKLKALTGSLNESKAVKKITMRVITDMQSISKSLEISASAAVSFMGINVSDKAKFIDNLSLTTYSVTVIAHGSFSTLKSVESVSWADGVKPPTSDSLLSFYQQYGDSYVKDITIGGEYIGVFTFYSQSSEESQTIQNELTTNGIVDGVRFDASLQTKLSNIQARTQTRQGFSQVLYGYTQLKPPETMDQVADFLDNKFSQTEPDAPVVVSYTSTGYEGLVDNNVFAPIVATRDLFDDPFRTDTIAEQCIDLTLARNQGRFILSVYQAYGQTVFDPNFRARLSEIENDWKSLRNLVGAINADPTKGYQLIPLESLSYGTPVLNFRVGLKGPWGGNGGDPFQDVSYRSVLNQTRITQLVMRGQRWVDKLQLTYENQVGSTTKVHGGDGGIPSTPLNLQKGEFITGISGTAGSYMNQLTFKTNYGQAFTWPPEPERANHFPAWTAGVNEVLIGFEGRSHKFLDQLRPLICTFELASWEK